MPFGPKTAPATMQRFVNDTFRKQLDEGWLINLLDDFYICMTGSVEEHMKHIREILDVMRKKSLFPKQSKCVWFTKEIEMMGFIVNKHGYQKRPERLVPIINYGTPTNPKEVRTFMGMVNFYRPFCNRLSIVAKALYELTGKDAKFVWTAQHQDAFTRVKCNSSRFRGGHGKFDWSGWSNHIM
ncbi:hypothetical protein SeLEV6574_g02241 [Synchytrium endobioticum]|uniref:Reverse transcriptase domain-containing protein n=1 Tax=Synchytrium endobioticum TaxID=286115 RepID=A0A507D9E3_9FUNG|nr:hypothetical protein SeLEV6574_g02241 [Synchytrium endobioticum]